MLNIRTKIIIGIMSIAILASLITAMFIERLTLLADEATSRSTMTGLTVTFVVVGLIAALFAWRIVKPFDDITIGMQIVSEGNLDHKMKKRSNDEFGRLVDSFNTMTEKLRKTQKRHEKISSLAAIEKNKAELIIDSMADSVIVTDSKHHIALMNPAAEKLFDHDMRKAIGKHIVGFLKKYKLESLFAEFPDMERMIPLREFRLKAIEITIEKPTRCVLRASLAPLRNQTSHITGMIIVFEDITRQKEIDDMKTEFVSIVSHELRTPLTSIKGYAALLGDGRMGELSEKQARAIHIINKESDRLHDLIEDILDLSKLEAGKSKLNLQMTDPMQCIEDCPVLSLPEKKNITFVKHSQKNVPKVMLDKAKITQVLTNLLSNAVKFTPEGGKITLKVSARQDHVRFDITDTGIGIAKKDFPKLFNKFYQVEKHLKRNQGGTGLGLPIVKEIVGLHHGVISVKSRQAKGTTFSFMLPRYGISHEELTRCWQERDCKKVSCPAFNNPEKRCWLVIGTQCKKGSTEACFDKIEICRHCSIYNQNIKDSAEDTLADPAGVKDPILAGDAKYKKKALAEIARRTTYHGKEK